jgi:hypothetical protein
MYASIQIVSNLLLNMSKRSKTQSDYFKDNSGKDRILLIPDLPGPDLCV